MGDTKTLPDMQPVESSNIQAIGYDPDDRALHIKFKTGGHYRYADVPSSVHQAFIDAPSKGKHFSQQFAGKYPHTKVSG